ncbi:MAG: DUF192 domain-containing protein [candidate division WWE3 bacterium]|nr:DUF192 domain-containing protein [candidate division WWE3 bacterium]
MKVTNQTRGTVVADQVYEARGLIERAFGLLNPKLPRFLFIRTRLGIHTFGLSAAIDVVIMNDSGQIVAMTEILKPWRVYLWNPKYDRVLELPSGAIKASKSRVGDTLVLE